MSDQLDRDYFGVRAAEEFERGSNASDACAAAIHFELAYRYGLAALAPVARMPKPNPVDGSNDRIAA